MYRALLRGGVVASSFTWLDYSEHERRQMLDVIHLFDEKTTRDELGIGVVRDAFADMFFPGTSTIQTRARYFLFIPWIYRGDRKSTRLNSSHANISYAVFCLKKKTNPLLHGDSEHQIS